MKKIIALFLIIILVGCSNAETPFSESGEGTIGDGIPLEDRIVSVNDFVNAFNSFDQQLETSKEDSISVFSEKLNGVKPESFLLGGKEMYIYEFNNMKKRESGWEAFQKKTETMSLISYKKYEMYNLLIFYIHEQDLNEHLDTDEIMNKVFEKLAGAS